MNVHLEYSGKQSIYDSLILEIQNLKLSGEIEIDEALFGGHHKGWKRGWGSIEHKNLVFGIYTRGEWNCYYTSSV